MINDKTFDKMSEYLATAKKHAVNAEKCFQLLIAKRDCGKKYQETADDFDGTLIQLKIRAEMADNLWREVFVKEIAEEQKQNK